MDKSDIKDFLLAGNIAGQAREFGLSRLQEGVSIRNVLDDVEDFIRSKGAGIAFPAQISLNKIAAHSCSDSRDETRLSSCDVAKLDVGAHINGFIGDTASTVNLDGAYSELLAASRDALNEASKLMVPQTTLGEIGKTIQETILSHGFHPVHNLSGHGLDQFKIHCAPQIPNIAIENSFRLEPGMTVACEPFATDGRGEIAETGVATVFSPQAVHRSVRSPFARQILKRITSYQGLPFASRWLENEFGIGKTRLGLKELQQAGLVSAHPPLGEIGGGMVSQAEHSFLITEGKPIISTKLQDQ